ncbi:radical SAM protein [Treponema pectinovorum]|uniref:radical SAM protein n=1 Tax=Treponema pectinovorum TaxID=164 RepID=UPI0011C995FD|nr:radical SAM protein [Treponema pectinovorum]
MKKIKSLKSENGDFDFIIKWRMTNSCNAHCSYCIRAKYTQQPEDLEEENKKLEKVATKLNLLIESLPQTRIKIDAVGGEVTILDLKKIFSKIPSKKLKRVSITTNLKRNAEYYIELSKFIPLSMTASFHAEIQNLQTYIAKIKRIKEEGKLHYLNCETVSTTQNAELVNSFIKQCEALDVFYMVEPDRRKENDSERKSFNYIAKSNKPRNVRYTVVFSDGTEKKYYVRSDFLAEFNCHYCCYGRFVPTKDLYCSCGYDYLYIKIDKAVGRKEGFAGCDNGMEIEEFKPLPKPAKCISDMCSLCGTMSLTDDDNTVEKNSEYDFDIQKKQDLSNLTQCKADFTINQNQPLTEKEKEDFMKMILSLPKQTQ